ncbi:hypothetical protein, partial [Bartonella sp. AA16SXTY]|uniref:hypothetical protein n=1 Tax=Bartonella sp. AA16SXTY TaxID=3243429 RepID=UPI0035D0C95B
STMIKNYQIALENSKNEDKNLKISSIKNKAKRNQRKRVILSFMLYSRYLMDILFEKISHFVVL